MAGNWKMFKTPAETSAFFEKFAPLVANSNHCEIVICPPFTDLAAAVQAVRGTRIAIGAQNIAWAKEGAFTGEISGPMIAALPTPSSGIASAGSISARPTKRSSSALRRPWNSA